MSEKHLHSDPEVGGRCTEAFQQFKKTKFKVEQICHDQFGTVMSNIIVDASHKLQPSTLARQKNGMSCARTKKNWLVYRLQKDAIRPEPIEKLTKSVAPDGLH